MSKQDRVPAPWPEIMSDVMAATYLDMSLSQFLSLVKQGRLPAGRAVFGSSMIRWRRAPRPVPLDAKKMILTGKKGRALAGEGTFSHLLNDACKAVPGLSIGLRIDGATDVTSHGLRYTAATRLHELGCSKEVIASITGHDTIEMVEKYIKKKREAQIAIGTLDEATAAQNSNESVKLIYQN